MVVWLRPHCILAIVTSLYYCSQLVSSKTYHKFWCATEEGHHELSCPDKTALLSDVTIYKIYRRTQTCQPDEHVDHLVHCEDYVDGSACEGNKTCHIEVSSRNYIKCHDAKYPPTYFFVKYNCAQIHTMCSDRDPIRNTLYGFIVSPAYPHPMADNLQCSIHIEAESSMFIELAPIQIHLEDTFKCRFEYLEIFGYINSLTNNSFSDDKSVDKTSKHIWKSYYTWCGAERSAYNPVLNARYLISSNLLYMSLQTATSRKPRSFKIRYKVVPSNIRSQYDSNGIAYDGLGKMPILSTTMTTILTTIHPAAVIVPTVKDNNSNKFNETSTQRTYRKEIIIGVVSGIVLLILAVAAGIGICLFIKRRRPTVAKALSKPTPPSALSSAGKKTTTPSTSMNKVTLKPDVKVSDKSPLIEQPNNATTAKRKLIPERTVQISDLNTSRFKSNNNPATKPAITTTTTTTTTTTATTPSPIQTPSSVPEAAPTMTATNTATVLKANAIEKETKSETAASPVTNSSTSPPTTKTVLTAADSGIYGADLSDDVPPVIKSLAMIESPSVYGSNLPDKSKSKSPVHVVVNPLNENDCPISTTTTENAISCSTIVPGNIINDPMPIKSQVPLFNRNSNSQHFDETVKSAYSNIIDATISENEGAIGSESIDSSAPQSRRTSNVKQPFLRHETNNSTAVSRKTTPFNPLHVILKKDANKYYTTEFI